MTGGILDLDSTLNIGIRILLACGTGLRAHDFFWWQSQPKLIFMISAPHKLHRNNQRLFGICPQYSCFCTSPEFHREKKDLSWIGVFPNWLRPMIDKTIDGSKFDCNSPRPALGNNFRIEGNCLSYTSSRLRLQELNTPIWIKFKMHFLGMLTLYQSKTLWQLITSE